MNTTPPPRANRTPASDRLTAAARLLAGLLIFLGLSALILSITPHARSGATTERAALLLDTLHLSHLSLWPSGRPLRAPEFSHAAVVLRPSPWVPFLEPGAERFVGGRPGPTPATNRRLRP